MVETAERSISQVLVVANQTLGGEDLVKFVQDRMATSACEFTLLVPATSRAHRDPGVRAPSMEILGHPRMASAAVEDDYADARNRLEFGLSTLQRLGATVDGDVGDPDPLKAIDAALARRRFDEIILSTLPSGASRWLRQDLPSKVERRFHLPVTVVTAG